MLSIVFAVFFLVVIFLVKNGLLFHNSEIYQNKNQANVTYKNEILGDLVNRDTDSDGVPDWEEKLWGTDPTKKETTPGIPDSMAIDKLKTTQGTNQQGESLLKKENLTKTDQFSRDLFATVAAASGDGQSLDQATVDKISSSLANHIQNSSPRKIYTLSDIKIINNDNTKDIQKYSLALNNIFSKNPPKYTVLDVLQKFMGDGNNVDVSTLSGLDPIIEWTNKIIVDMLKTTTPQSLATLHLNVINGFEGMVDNLNDIKLYDTDTIVAFGGISQYYQNTAVLESATQNLNNILNKKLND